MLCDINWRKFEFEKYNCKGMAVNNGNGDITVSGIVKTESVNPKVIFWAANPPGYLTSYSGSGLPFYNKEQAFENTTNKGLVIALSREFSFKIKYPNSYYAGLGSIYVPPKLYMKVCEEGTDEGNVLSIDLGKGIPYRSLTYPPQQKDSRPRNSPLFYYGGWELPVITQEKILRNAGYPATNEMPANFWGMKPPL